MPRAAKPIKESANKAELAKVKSVKPKALAETPAKANVRPRKPPASGALAKAVTIVDAATLDWRPAGKEGLALKVVREDRAKGLFLGAVAFEPMARSGLHQHQGVATSFFARGGLTDYSGSAVLHDIGINLKGSTHDAIAYESSLLISRLEGPVTYPEGAGSLHGLHIGAYHAEVENERPDVAPEINVPLASVSAFATGVQGLTRRTLFDYAGVGDNHRMLQWTLRPGTTVPRFKATALVEMWMHAGDLAINGASAHADCFVIIEPGQEVSLASAFGARLLVWTEGPALAVDALEPNGLFGY